MTVVLHPITDDGAEQAIAALREWQHDDAPFQLHPGDLGWFARFGKERMRDAVRTWRRHDRIIAVGLLDGADLLRLTTAPDVARDAELARQLVADLGDPARGVFAAGAAYLETPTGSLVRELLTDAGWATDEAWTPLVRDLGNPVEPAALRVERVTPDLVETRVALQRSAFETSTFTPDAWAAMAAGSGFAAARDLIGFDADDTPVATITVWSAGPGLPGLIEPMGVHRDHRGRGYGRAITLAGCAALRELGASSASVCTGSSKVGAIATYRSAGMIPLAERLDVARTS